MNDENELAPVPKATDWTVLSGGGKVFLESETVANADDYDDALFQVTGNMSFEAKEALATYAARKLNDRWHSPKEVELLRVERDMLARVKLANEEEIRALHDRLVVEGEVVVTWHPDGRIVAVTRQDDEGRILKVIAEAGDQPKVQQP